MLRFEKQERTCPYYLLQIGVLLLLPCHSRAQESLTLIKTFEIAGENMSAGVELIDPNAVILDGTRIWIADEGLMKVMVIDEQTGLRYEFGQNGEGPGEFRTLAALTTLSHSQIAVLDRGTSRISILELTSKGLSALRCFVWVAE